MSKALNAVLSRRERQIMDILFRRGRATAAEVMADLAGEPSYSTVRTQLRVLEQKGHVRHGQDGARFVYSPVVARHAARGVLRTGAQPPHRRRSGRGPQGPHRATRALAPGLRGSLTAPGRASRAELSRRSAKSR